MAENNDIWKSIESEQKVYDSLKLGEIKDYNKFYLYSIIAHSTAIEGSTLSEKDTQILFDEGLTGKTSKPIIEYMMNLDLKAAYEFAIEEAKKKTLITPDFLKKLNSLLMKNTGSVNNSMAGTFDSSAGDYRLCGVRAGIDGKSYMNYLKVPDKVEQLCNVINDRINLKSTKDIYNLSFDAHLNLAAIHPWVDGNGRTSRLLMNYIQFYNGLTPTKLHKEDRADYIKALEKSQDSETPDAFRDFMAAQQLKTLREEIQNHQISTKRSNGFHLIF